MLLDPFLRFQGSAVAALIPADLMIPADVDPLDERPISPAFAELLPDDIHGSRTSRLIPTDPPPLLLDDEPPACPLSRSDLE